MDKIFRLLGGYFLLDGLLTLIFGKSYVRLFRFGSRKSIYRRAIEWLLDWPAWQLHLAGAGEAALGNALLNRAPLDVQMLYQNIARGYAAIDPGWREWFYPQAHEAFDQALNSYLPEGGDILDLGSGLGANLARLQAMDLPYGSYIGVDITQGMLQRARERYGRLPNVRFEQLDLMSDPLPTGPYDLIVSTWVFEHLPDPALVAYKAWERLKPDGHLILLFEVETNTWASRLIRQIYPLLSVRLVPQKEIERMPGIQSEQRFSGPIGELALVVTKKAA